MSHTGQKKVIHSIRTQVDTFGRKKYKLEQVLNSGEQEEQKNVKTSIIDTGRHKSMLIGRQQSLNIQKYKGKIQTNRKKKVTQVFYCDVCSEGFKCDMAYLTHVNSPAHNRKLGMNMKVKSVSLESVSSKISSLINKKAEKQNSRQFQSQLLSKNQKDHTDSSQEKDEQEQNLKQEPQVKSQNEVDKNNQQEQEINEDELVELQMMRQMGLPTAFGSKKHKR